MTVGTTEFILLVVFAAELLIAAGVDARRRMLPNRLAVALAATASLVCVAHAGPARLAVNTAFAAIIVGALFAFELFWRRLHATAGQGMGDLKALCALCLVHPGAALASYALGLLALAFGCVLCRTKSLPLLPFLVPVFFVVSVFLDLGVAL